MAQTTPTEISQLSSSRTVSRGFVGLARDVVALGKPRITVMVAFTGLGGFWLAASYFGQSPTYPQDRLIGLLVGISLLVAGANALNMYIERNSDALMRRTQNRPLPAGRLHPDVALAFGLLTTALALPLLTFVVHPLTGLLGLIASVSYVLAYTPLKRRTPHAVLVGAVPGALPPLLGWSAARGSIDFPGLVLFGIMFFWQIPHFHAIALFRRDEYARAGIAVLPVSRGERTTRHHIVRYLAALLLSSFLLVPFGIGGTAYLVAASLLGALFFGFGLWGLRGEPGRRWARSLFFVSILYVVGIFGALTLG